MESFRIINVTCNFMRRPLIIVFILISFVIGWLLNDLNHFLKGMAQDIYHPLPDSFFLKIPKLEYRPIVVAKSNVIKLGEEYVADVRLAVINSKKPPLVLLGKNYSGNFKSSGDTLKFDAESQASTFRQTPRKIGKQIWEGILLSNIDTTSLPYYFHVEYNVVK